MKHNNNSIYERQLVEMPKTCGDCIFLNKGVFDFCVCTANGGYTHTYDFINPNDRPLPLNLMCPWWYASHIWHKVSKDKQKGYQEERLCELTFWAAVNAGVICGERKKEVIKHMHRRGGGGIIDFKEFPELKEFYNIVKANDNRIF